MQLTQHDLDAATPEELDALPYGVVRVDGAGHVAFYNAAEARLTGNDPQRVAGRNFFADLAPCTNCATFHGRFLERVGDDAFDRQFEFDFNFKIDPVRVAVRMVASLAHAGHTWIVVRPLHLLDADDARAEPMAGAALPTLRSEKDLAKCANEPIHLCAAVQPHGVLMTVDPTRREILQVSTNCSELLGRSVTALLGSRIDELLPERVVDALLATLVGDGDDGRRDRVRRHRLTATVDDLTFEICAFADDGVCVLEWLPEYARARQRHPGQTTAELADGMHAISACSDFAELDATLLAAVRRLAPFERVMIYAFRDDGSGVVVAEQRRDDGLASYLGVHFPESDIPRQARALYAKSTMRYVPNLAYRAAPVTPARVPTHGGELDLSHSRLRSLSPNHLAYHRAIGIGASLSISLLREGRLWGLLIAHHGEPLYVDAEVRSALEALAHHHALQREVLERRDRERILAHKRQAFAEHRSGITCARELLDGVANGARWLLDLFEASGVALLLDGRIVVLGCTPDKDQIRRLLSFLGRSRVDDVFVTDRLPALWPPATEYAAVASGLLAITLGRNRNDAILLFRGEQLQRIRWGSPPAAEGPRGDRVGGFDIVEERCRGRALAWPEWATVLAGIVQHEIQEWVLRDLSRMQQLAEHADRDNRISADLLSNISHELRTPLAAVLGAGDLIAETDLAREQRELLEIDRRSARDLAQKLEQIFQYSQLRSGVADFDAEAFDVVAALEAIAEQRRRELGATSGIVLEVELPRGPCWVEGSLPRFRQIARELIANACRFTEAGRVQVHLSVGLGAAHGVRRVLLKVTDSGPGLPDEPERLFEPFTQGDSSSRRRFAGMGLGLAITRLVVRALRGRIGARPAPAGAGAQFWVALPFEAAAPRCAAAPQDTRHMRILYVDDEPLNRRLFAGMLGRRGHAVTCCASGPDGVEAARRSDFDVIVLDIQMPGMDGAEVCGVLLDELHVDCPIVALSADSLSQRVEQCFRVGFSRYLTKPVRDWGLLEAELQLLGQQSPHGGTRRALR